MEQKSKGVWVTYDYDTGPYALAIFEGNDSGQLKAGAWISQNGYGLYAFWPWGMEFTEAITEWQSRADVGVPTGVCTSRYRVPSMKGEIVHCLVHAPHENRPHFYFTSEVPPRFWSWTDDEAFTDD